MPFVLISYAGNKSNLHAVPFDVQINTTAVCLPLERIYSSVCKSPATWFEELFEMQK